MYWYQVLRVKLNERVIVLDGSLPRIALGPGVHRVWGARLGELRWNTDELVLDARPELRAVLPKAWFAELTVGSRQRAVLFKDGRPMLFLRPGTHRYWTVDPSVCLQTYDVDEPMPALSDELMRVIPASEYVCKLVASHERGLLFVKGELRSVLAPGQYAVWSHAEAPARIDVLDVRAQQLTLSAQELMTRDKVTLRLTLSVEHALEDPALAHGAVTDVRDALYLHVQLAARDYVAGVTLDQLLEGREAMTRAIEASVVPAARAFGVRVSRVGVKDVVLPGEMKALLNRVIEAEKEAAANVILRREEAAATRLLAASARTMAAEPVLLRLKELDTMKEMAARVQELRLVVGSEAIGKLLPLHVDAKARG